jgi:integrase
MTIYRRGVTWWYHFLYEGQHIQESAKTRSKSVAKDRERNRRLELDKALNSPADRRKDRARTLNELADAYLEEYRLKHKAVTFAEYAVDHVLDHLGEKMLIEIGDEAVRGYQIARLKEKASPKSINEEVGFLLRIMGERGDLLRGVLKRKRLLKLQVSAQPGKAFNIEQKDALMAAAKVSRSKLIQPALSLALNAGMRDGEIKRTQWSQIDFDKALLTVGKSKTAAGEGRTIPLNSEILDALEQHAVWYKKKFKQIRPEWYVFPFGKRGLMDPCKPITTLKTAWGHVRDLAKVDGRWHDARHTLITELAESGAGDQTIMDIAGHVSRQMLARYSHIRTEAKRNALEEVVRRREDARAVGSQKKKMSQREPRLRAKRKIR